MINQKVHNIKTIQPFFNDVKSGVKRFELRLNDRNYKVGDIAKMEEWTGTEYTGNIVIHEIKYVLKDCPEYGLMPGYCIFGW